MATWRNCITVDLDEREEAKALAALVIGMMAGALASAIMHAWVW